MKKVILDTNFILTCIKQKIDFFSYLTENGFQILVPKQVFNELKKLAKKSSVSGTNAKLALKLLKDKKSNFKTLDLKISYVDKGIRKYIIDKPEIVIATLDRELKKLPNKKIIIRGKEKLEMV